MGTCTRCPSCPPGPGLPVALRSWHGLAASCVLNPSLSCALHTSCGSKKPDRCPIPRHGPPQLMPCLGTLLMQHRLSVPPPAGVRPGAHRHIQFLPLNVVVLATSPSRSLPCSLFVSRVMQGIQHMLLVCVVGGPRAFHSPRQSLYLSATLKCKSATRENPVEPDKAHPEQILKLQARLLHCSPHHTDGLWHSYLPQSPRDVAGPSLCLS